VDKTEAENTSVAFVVTVLSQRANQMWQLAEVTP
jgi:hypothetical protein